MYVHSIYAYRIIDVYEVLVVDTTPPDCIYLSIYISIDLYNYISMLLFLFIGRKYCANLGRRQGSNCYS